MKHIHYLYIGALALLIACSSEERITTTNGNDRSSDAIELSAGIVEGNARATTRTGAEDNHDTPGHQAFSDNTKIALRVSGTWTLHEPSTIVETTTASLNGVAEETGNRHNKLSSSPVLYWEDYGSSDIANMGTGKGREEGLTIYGAAVDGVASVPSGLISSGTTIDGTLGKWTGLSWTLDADQSSGFSAKDLLISNNISGDNGDPYETDYGRYLFDERKNGKLLEFKHAMSKITVNLKAGDGFAGYSFAEAYPVVYLTGNEGDPSDDYAWAYTTGTVNITTGAITGQGGLKYITMSQALTPNGDNNITKEALVMPGSLFKKPTGTASNLVYPVIVRIKVDGNIYYVTSEMIRKAIDPTNYNNPSSTNFETEAGKNYVINIIVNQTGISVTATVANWTNISADNVAPVINLVGQLGGSASNWEADKSFSFYRSTALNEGYSSASALLINNCYKEESVLNFTNSSQTWSMSPVLYWPNHNTHYQFRAVWPRTVTTADDGNFTDPRVVSGVNSVAGLQIIKVKNVAYSGGSFPSDLMIARPNVANVAGNCGSNESDVVHPKKNLYTEGICARTGAINLTFNYMMSKVGVNLSTKENSSDPDYVNLTNAKVEIVNVYNNGDVILGNRTVNCGNYSPGSYTLHPTATSTQRLDAIVPQTFTYSSALASGNTKLRITIYNNGDTNSIDDIYEADLKTIPVQEGSSPAAAVDGWESGKSYVYNLRLTKTKVQVTASLTPWTEVTATQDIWF